MKQKFQQSQKFNLKLTPSLLNQINILSLTGKEMRKEFSKLIEELLEEENNNKLIKKFREQILIDNFINFVNPQKKQEYEGIELSTEETLQETLLDAVLVGESDYSFADI